MYIDWEQQKAERRSHDVRLLFSIRYFHRPFSAESHFNELADESKNNDTEQLHSTGD